VNSIDRTTGRDLRPFPRSSLLILLLGVALLAAYLPTFHAPFTFDDIRNITDNPSLRMTRIGASSALRAIKQSESLNPGRPVAHLSFALNYRFGGRDPFGYHVTNFLILLFSVPSAFWLAFLLARTWLPPPEAKAAALGAAALWATNPLLTNGVTYVVQRMTSLCALFSILALACFLQGLRSRRWIWHFVGAGAWILALGTKETALLVPLLALLFLWLSPQKRPGKRRFGTLLISLVVLSQAALVALVTATNWYSGHAFTLVERLMTEGRVVLRYISLYLLPLPSRLNLDYDFPLSTAPLLPLSTIPAYLVHGLIILTALLVHRKRPLLSFSLLAFYLLQLLESTSLPLIIIFEHRAYLAAFFLSLAVMDLLLQVFARFRKVPVPQAALVSALLIAAWWGTLTYQRNLVWADQVRLWNDVAAKSPGSARAHINLGVALLREGHAEEAAVHFRETLRLAPGLAEAHNNLANAVLQLGDAGAAERSLKEALRLDPELATAHNNLGNLLLQQGNPGGAAEHYREALRLKPWCAETRHNLGITLAGLGRTRESIEQYLLALEYDPENAEIHYNLGVALAREGRLEEAEGRFVEVLRLDGSHAEAHYNLGVVHATSRRWDKARISFIEALRLRPGYAEARHNLEALLSRQGLRNPD